MAVTIKDIARCTGLGLATVSSFINGGNVREYNRVKIVKAIDELGFEVNELARGLKTNSTKTIGVVIPELSNLFFTQIISYAGDVLRESGYAIIVCDCRTNVKTEKEVIEFLLKKRVDGLIISPVSTDSEFLCEVALKKPVVLLDRLISGVQCSSVLIDNRGAIKQAVSLLVQSGHKNIGFIGGPKGTYTVNERLEGYIEAIEENGINIQKSLIAHSDYSILDGSNGAKTLLSNNQNMTAMVCSNYEITVGTLIALNENVLKVPENMSIVGFDNVEFAKAHNPEITIITQPVKQIGEIAATILLERILNKDINIQHKHIVFQTAVLYGNSIKKLI